MNFDKKDYKKVIKNIEASRGYLSYIDSHRRIGAVNPRYKRYIDTKQTLYTVRPPKLPNKNTAIITYQLPDGLTEDGINELYEKYGVQNDYYIENKLIREDIPFTKMYSYQAIPIESAIMEDSIELDKRIEKLNRTCLSDKFITNNHRRFMMLPFVLKMGENYVEPIVIANVYDVGIITIQLSLYFELEKVPELTEKPPRYEVFPEIYFYKILDNYKTNDFWEKEVLHNLTADEIIEYYEKQIITISRVSLKSNPDNRSLSWVFGDFELNKYANHKDFIDKYKRFYASYLTNGTKGVIERKTNKEIDSILSDALITESSEICYYCAPTSSVVSIGYKSFFELAKTSLVENEKELKKEGIYNLHLNQIFRVQTLDTMIQFLRFYELTFIKRYFLKELLNDIYSENYQTIKDYNAVKRELNFIKLQYDEEVLFFTEGSPKELYKSILKYTNVDNLQTKAEELVKNIREDVSIIRDADIKKNETLILTITSLLTILLGYRGIKFIVNDVFANLPIVGKFVGQHPLRYTVTIWGVLIATMLWLNIKRWRINNK